MRQAINSSVNIFSECFSPTGPVIEAGSLYLPGYQELCDLRPYFAGMDYFGCDIRLGPGVDCIGDAQALCIPDNSVGTMLIFEVLEHVPHPEKVVTEAHRVLRDDGHLALSVPFNYRLHGFPTDYWRFTSSGVSTLLSDFPAKVVFALGPRLKPAFIFAVAAKSSSSEFVDKEVQFRSTVMESFRKSRLQGHTSVLKERARDFFGLLLGRAELSATFFDPGMPGGYVEGTE